MKLKPTPWLKITSPIFPMMNSEESILDMLQKNKSNMLKKNLTTKSSVTSIGSLKVPSKELKIKVNVDLVGLSPPLLLLNLSIISLKEP